MVEKLIFVDFMNTLGITVTTNRRDSFEIVEPSKISFKMERRHSSGARTHIEMTLTKQDRF